MFITRILSKVKNPWVIMQMQSVASGHKFTVARLREEIKEPMIRFDPFIQRDSVYKDYKKLKSRKFIGLDYSHKL